MQKNLEPIKAILKDLKNQIDRKKSRIPSNEKIVEACCWIYGSPDYVFLEGTTHQSTQEFPGQHRNALAEYREWIVKNSGSAFDFPKTANRNSKKKMFSYWISVLKLSNPQGLRKLSSSIF